MVQRVSITSYAQNLEDVLLWRALGHLGDGFYIDIGAQDPIKDSVSLAFYERGWRGVHVEPTQRYAEDLRRARPDEVVIQAAVGDCEGSARFFSIANSGLSTGDPKLAEQHRAAGFQVEEASVAWVKLSEILDRFPGADIHWLKIDVEGMEANVVRSWFPSQARPWIVVIESTKPLSQLETHREWEPCLLSLGYEFVHYDGLNRFYVSIEHPELESAFYAGPNVFDGYVLSGTASTAACTLLNRRIEEKEKALESLLQDFFHQSEKLSNALLKEAQKEREISKVVNEAARLQQALSEQKVQTEQEIIRLTNEGARLQQALDANEKEIKKIYASASWRVTSPLRKVKQHSKLLFAPRRHAASRRVAKRRLSRSASLSLHVVAKAAGNFGWQKLIIKAWNAYQSGGLTRLRQSYYKFAALQSAAKAGEHRTLPAGHRGEVNEGQGGVSSGRLVLGEDFSVDDSTWEEYLREILPSKQSWNAPPSAAKLCVVIDCRDDELEGAIQVTREAIRGLSSVATYSVRSFWLSKDPQTTPRQGGHHELRGDLEQMTSTIGPNELLLWIRPGDKVLPEFANAIAEWNCFEVDFCLIDMFYRDNERAYPLLLHSVDVVHAEFVDYYWSRFGIRGAMLDEVLRCGARSAYQISKAAIRRCEAAATGCHESRYRLLPLPLLEVAINHERLISARKTLLRSNAELTFGQMPNKHGATGNRERLKVSAIICTKDSGLLLRQLLSNLLHHDAIHDVIIVSNNTSNEYARQTLRAAKENDRAVVLSYDGPFNFSKQCNLGARHGQGDLLLFLNDDVSPTSSGWLSCLVSWLEDLPRRVVAPLLLYPNETVQHAGMFLGYNNVAGHAFRHAKLADGYHNLLLAAPRQTSCLTGAAMLVPRYVFEELNGFDPLLGTYLQDVDFSLRALASGVQLILDPRAIMFHMESVSVKPSLVREDIGRVRQREFDYFYRRWNQTLTSDNWVNPLVDRMDETFRSLRRQ